MRRMQGIQLIAILLVLGVGIVGCRSALIPAPTKNPIPAGMSLEDIKLLIALSIDPSVKTNWNTTSTPSQKALKEMFTSGQSNPQWSLEAIEPRAITAGYSKRIGKHYSQYYLAVRIHFSNTERWIAIIDGTKLGFDGERIHKNALVWVSGLEQKNRQSFGTYQAMVELEK